eukprot:CAMPEP_0116842164 /NCGR_PEP_ID=MMETSP0418-20121206/11358_1 /TAXON_ID=1158023 /ORGANISM="Astrosyne radiata, Strain 13vi08-1A" /LENGTH=164 /DNA_ID=CAMNT_0004472731 /DNA_START=366 /DNA_END=862 /DNA_ORIENTATION=+
MSSAGRGEAAATGGDAIAISRALANTSSFPDFLQSVAVAATAATAVPNAGLKVPAAAATKAYWHQQSRHIAALTAASWAEALASTLYQPAAPACDLPILPWDKEVLAPALEPVQLAVMGHGNHSDSTTASWRSSHDNPPLDEVSVTITACYALPSLGLGIPQLP